VVSWSRVVNIFYLESFATLFSRKVKLFIYPTLRNGVIMNCLRFYPPPHLIDLYRYLIANNKIEDIRNYNENNLHVQTDIVLQLIKQGVEGWEQYVPVEVAAMIKERCLFGFPCAVDPAKQLDEPKQAQQLSKS
jgi:hypothetical protein